MISVREARKLVLRNARALEAECLPLVAANGRVLTAGILAAFPLPRFTNSAMDGYAVRSAETRDARDGRPVRLGLRRGTILAGRDAPTAVPPQTAVRIMTGAPLPPGLDAVLPQEEARLESGSLVVTKRIPPRRYVRLQGEDCAAGSVLARAGRRIDPGLVALLSACGVTEVEVHRSPRVALIVTGDEVRGSRNGGPRGHEVFDAHTGFLRTALSEFDLEMDSACRSRDHAPAIAARAARALDSADLLIVTGGVSVGERDLVRPVLSSLGVRALFSGVSQKPGKPIFFGTRGRCLVFGLPGNPFSMVVCYCLYVRPALKRMLGLPNQAPEEMSAELIRPVSRSGARPEFVRGRTTGRNGTLSVIPVLHEGSHRLYPFRESDCLIAVPSKAPSPLPRGATVRIHPFPWRRP